MNNKTSCGVRTEDSKRRDIFSLSCRSMGYLFPTIELVISLVGAVILASFHAQAQPSPYRHARPERPRAESQCSNLSVEPQIHLTPQGSPSDTPYRVMDFIVTVFVSNQCPEPIQLLPGSFVSYQTNFPSFIPDAVQPPECVRQQQSFSGTVPPFQKAPFLFRAQGCAFPATQGESPRVTLEAGRVLTNAGETPVPTITEVSP